MPQSKSNIKAVFFDFMGTCLDWHSSVVQSMPSAIPEDEASRLALEWRKQYFGSNSKHLSQGLPPEDIDDTLAHTLEDVLDKFPKSKTHLDSETRQRMVQAWHKQAAWPDVVATVQALQTSLNLETFVHANGTTRLQLDLVRSSGITFNMLFSSQMLGVYKPSPEAYQKALALVKLKPDEVVMVAAHAYDLRGAQKCGIKTVYIRRWTDDVDEDMERIKIEFDAFLEGMENLPDVILRMQQ